MPRRSVADFLAPLFLVLALGAANPGVASAQDAAGSSRFYAVERLNAGLEPAPDSVNLETPQATMETFVFAAERGDWATAAHALDLSHLEEAAQAERGPALAKQLHETIQRAVWLDWNALPDRPDALEANTTTKDPMAGEPRRSLRIALVELPDRPVSIRLSRVRPEEGAAAWLFSAQTVDNIPAMHAVYGPTRFELALPEALRERAFWTLAWWEVIAVPLLLLVALAAGALAHGFVGRLKRRQPSRIAGRILDSIQTPVALIAFVATFALVKAFLFTFSGAINTFLNPLQTAIFIVALALVGVRIVDAVLDRIARRNIEELSDRATRDERGLYTNISAARRIAIAFVFVLGAALVLVQVNAFETLGFSLLASAGAIGLVLAFAARSILSDVMASLQIAFAKTARIGDAVLYEDQWCYVEKINFTHLQLRTWDYRRLMVPVNEFVSCTVENWSKQDPSLIKPVLLRLDHRADIDRLREAFARFVEEDEEVILKEDSKVQVIDQDERGIAVRFYAAAADPLSAWNMHCRLREAMLKRVAELDADAAPEEQGGAAYIPRERELHLSSLSSPPTSGATNGQAEGA